MPLQLSSAILLWAELRGLDLDQVCIHSACFPSDISALDGHRFDKVILCRVAKTLETGPDKLLQTAARIQHSEEPLTFEEFRRWVEAIETLECLSS